MSLVLVLTSCLSINTNTGDKSNQEDSEVVEIKVVRDGVELSEAEVKREEEKLKESLGYHEDIKTAIENSELYPIAELKEVLKTVENDDKIIVYGVIAYEKGYEQFTIMPLLKKKDEETGEFLYSEPWMTPSETHESYGESWVERERWKHGFFQLLNFARRDEITIPEKKNFQIFLLGIKEEAEAIKVNGHKPDGIIEHEVVDQDLKKQKSYFVYFDDIEMSGNFDDMEITFFEN